MSLQKYSIFALSIFLASCASTHPGTMGKSLTSKSELPLKISAETIEESGSKTFQLIEVTFENVGQDWLRISRAEIVIKNPGETKLSVVTGEDLKFWGQAMELKIKQETHNKQVQQLGLGSAGVATANSSSKSSDAFTLGVAAITAFSAWVTHDIIKHSLDAAIRVEKVPDNHLYHPFAVPGLMTMRRWVLLNKPVNSVIDKLAIEIETVEGEKEIYEIAM